jgi:hypothetical protein
MGRPFAGLIDFESDYQSKKGGSILLHGCACRKQESPA